MIDLGLSKMALVGVVALIVIGPEKLPRVARTLGAWVGKAQRYVSDVKAEVNRSMDLEELKKMKATMESAAQEVAQSAQTSAAQFEQDWAAATASLGADATDPWQSPVPAYKHPAKNWRLKRSAMPQWFKARQGVRTRALSGAARVARYRPKGLS